MAWWVVGCCRRVVVHYSSISVLAEPFRRFELGPAVRVGHQPGRHSCLGIPELNFQNSKICPVVLLLPRFDWFEKGLKSIHNLLGISICFRLAPFLSLSRSHSQNKCHVPSVCSAAMRCLKWMMDRWKKIGVF
jgi:hypothetical protein